MPSGYSFRPRAWAVALAALACAGGIALGNWQAGRAEEKRALEAQLEKAMRAPPIELPAGSVDPDSVVLKRVAARGRFVGEHTIFLDNKLRRGRPALANPANQSASTRRAATNASWGTSTDPTIFIRFFPSFWRSRSLRLRVISPP